MPSKNNTRSRRTLWVVSALAVAVVAVLAWGAAKPSGPSATGPEAQRQDDDGGTSAQMKSLQRRNPGDPYALGRADAPVVMIQYEDYRCPFCSKFNTEVAPELIDRYVRTGVLRIEWRDFPIFGEQSVEVAKAARAAARQGRFWQFHDAAYAVGDGSSKPSFDPGRILDVARSAGVPDLARFNSDRADPAIAREIATDQNEGEQLGVPSTPAFMINGQAVLGAQPLQDFVSTIEAERAHS